MASRGRNKRDKENASSGVDMSVEDYLKQVREAFYSTKISACKVHMKRVLT